MKRCISTNSEHHLHRGTISWRRQAFFIVVLYMSTPIHHISIEKQQLIEATHRLGLDTDQSPPLSFSTLHRDQWHTGWGGTSRTHPLAVLLLYPDFFFDNNNDAALHGTFMSDPGLDGIGIDFTSDDHSSFTADHRRCNLLYLHRYAAVRTIISTLQRCCTRHHRQLNLTCTKTPPMVFAAATTITTIIAVDKASRPLIVIAQIPALQTKEMTPMRGREG